MQLESGWVGREGDRALIQDVLRGNQVAERHFVERYSRYVRALAARHGLSRADGDDLCQDVLVRLWEDDKRRLRLWYDRPRESGAIGKDERHFSAFLSVVAAHLLYDRRRAQAAANRRATAAGETDWDQRTSPILPEQAVLDRVRAAAIHEALRKLGGREAILIARRHLKGESYREIAEGMGMTVNCVGVTLGRAERRFRDHIVRHEILL